MTAAARPDRSASFAFRFDRTLAPLGRVFGVAPSAAEVTLDGDDLAVRFGRWRLSTPIANIASVAITGPYRPWRVAGPARLSLADHGITFATTAEQGVCLGFHEPVPGIDPLGLIRHPNLTVTVDDVAGFVAALRERAGGRLDLPGASRRDDLGALTASELRRLADDEGIQGASHLKKRELLAILQAIDEPSTAELATT